MCAGMREIMTRSDHRERKGNAVNTRTKGKIDIILDILDNIRYPR